jgi:hypothetical protein
MFYDICTTGTTSYAIHCPVIDHDETLIQRFRSSVPPTLFFDVISNDGRQFHLSSKLTVSVSQEENMVILETKTLPIIAYGETLEQASAAFQEHFSFIWESIAQQPDEVLSPDAQDIKRTQRGMVSYLTAA